MARAMKIAYGPIATPTVVNNCTLQAIELHRALRGFGVFEVSFQLLLTTNNDDPTDFAAAVAAVEGNFSTPYQDFLLSWQDPQGAAADVVLVRHSHSDATGLEIKAEIRKVGDEQRDTALSRVYEVRISGELPPTAGGVGDESYDLRAGPNCRRTLTVRGRYSAINGGTGAAANAQAKIGAKAAALVASLGGTENWKLVSNDLENVSSNDQLAEAVQEWEERLFPDLAGTLNDPRLRRVRLNVRRTREGSRGSLNERRLATMSATFSAEVCHMETTALQSLYENEVQPWVVANMKQLAPGTFFALIRDEPDYELTDNTFVAVLVALTSSGGELLELDRSETLNVGHGPIFLEIWEDEDHIADEVPTPAYVYPGPKPITFTEEVRQVRLGQSPSLNPGGSAGGGPAQRVGPQPAANNPFARLFGVGAISAPGESFLNFLGPESSAFPGGGAAASSASGGQAAFAGARGVPVETVHRLKHRAEGIPPNQFPVTERTTTRTTRWIKDASVAQGNPQPAENGPTRTR